MPANPLTASDREQIRAGIERGDSDACIARGLGRHRSTIGREIACNGGRAAYTATKAQVRADKARLRPKAPMLVAEPELAWQVTKRLVAGDSPMTISIELAQGLHGYTANISHETIYQGVYAPKRHGLPTKVYKMLHRRRPRRRHTGQRHSQQRSAFSASSTSFTTAHPPPRHGQRSVTSKATRSSAPATSPPSSPSSTAKPGTCGSPATTHPTVPTPP